MRSSIFKLLIPAFIVSLILVMLDDMGMPIEFIVAGAMSAGFILRGIYETGTTD